jgi:hypothetical protein
MSEIAQPTALDIDSSAQGAKFAGVFRAGALASGVLMAYSLATMVIVFALGAAPETARATFDLLQADRLVGMLRLDILTVFCMPLYYVLFFSVYLALKKSGGAVALITILLMAGLTLFLATPSIFSWISLSDRFAAAADPAQKNLLLAAGEAVLASDMWHGTGPIIGGLLMQISATLVSVFMLRAGSPFGRWTAWVGILTHGFDLLHILGGFVTPILSIAGMAVAGPLYLVWFPLVALDFWRLSRSDKTMGEGLPASRTKGA